MSLPADWELVVGLEVHCELATATKLFCGCPNAFGAEPNTNVCPVCLGLPGSLPVLNASAVEFAMRLGRALHCGLRAGVMARKNYFYPDMPKDYQVSQYDLPTNVDGWLELPDGTRVGIERAHIEEDTGKITHVGGAGGRIHDAAHSIVDYNRAGVPLVEIVGRPDIRSSEAARAYVDELRSIVTALGVSDARMEEGSMRVDANVSVRPAGSDELRTRCEIKNINSLRSLGRAIDYEALRHVDLYLGGQSPRQETRHWDEEGGRTLPGRSKEDAEDYRYFPEPDLVPIMPVEGTAERIDAELPALPAERRRRLAEATGAAPEEMALVVTRGLDDLVVAAVEAGADGAKAVTRVENDLADVAPGHLDPGAFARLMVMETTGELTASQSKTVLAALVADGGDPAAIAAALGFEAMDTGEVDTIVDEMIAANPDAWDELVAADREGDAKARKKKLGFFTGQVMQATKGSADGRAVNEAFGRRLAEA